MSDFWLYLQLGLEHITDIKGYDHILFILALIATFSTKDLKFIVWLITGFTVGHSITLALATLDIIPINSEFIETLIPITILIVCISNLFNSKEKRHQPHYLRINVPFKRYFFEAIFFGLIHGMGFSNYLKTLLGSQDSVWEPLLAFNLGLEFGQLVIVAVILMINAIIMKLTSFTQRDWNIFITGGAFVSSLIILFG